MATLAVVGTQWGDEGKGKVTDYLGDYLSENFRLKDRRSEPEYAVWNHSVKNYLKRTKQTERQEEAEKMIQNGGTAQSSVR